MRDVCESGAEVSASDTKWGREEKLTPFHQLAFPRAR
jgi:hypothetical protein